MGGGQEGVMSVPVSPLCCCVSPHSGGASRGRCSRSSSSASLGGGGDRESGRGHEGPRASHDGGGTTHLSLWRRWTCRRPSSAPKRCRAPSSSCSTNRLRDPGVWERQGGGARETQVLGGGGARRPRGREPGIQALTWPHRLRVPAAPLPPAGGALWGGGRSLSPPTGEPGIHGGWSQAPGGWSQTSVGEESGLRGGGATGTQGAHPGSAASPVPPPVAPVQPPTGRGSTGEGTQGWGGGDTPGVGERGRRGGGDGTPQGSGAHVRFTQVFVFLRDVIELLPELLPAGAGETGVM